MIKNAKPRKQCSIEGCDRFVAGRGWCGKHYANWKRNGEPVSTHNDPAARFARATVEGPIPDYRPDLGPCLLYTGGTNSNGYGQFRYNGRGSYVHRYAWEVVNGPIPSDKEIDHLCRVRTCARASHLDLVDSPTNTRRAAQARRKCKKGHQINDSNRKPGSIARCLTCHNETVKESGRRRTKTAQGLPDTRVRFDQKIVRAQIIEVRAARSTIAEAARVIGCHANYLGRRIWTETKADVRARDEVCVRCGMPGALDVQHRKARGRGGSSNPQTSFGMANLIALDRECHSHVEQHREESRRLGFAVAQHDDPELVPILHWTHGTAFLSTKGGWWPIGRDYQGTDYLAWITEQRGVPADSAEYLRIQERILNGLLGIDGPNGITRDLDALETEVVKDAWDREWGL